MSNTPSEGAMTEMERLAERVETFNTKLRRIVTLDDAMLSASGKATAIAMLATLSMEDFAAIPNALRANAKAAAEVERHKATLADPAAVHVNMLRGSIAKPAPRSIIHLYGEKAIREALGDTPRVRSQGETR